MHLTLTKIPNNVFHKKLAIVQCKKRSIVDPKLALHITHILGEIAFYGLSACDISPVLILLSTVVQIKNLTFEDALDF